MSVYLQNELDDCILYFSGESPQSPHLTDIVKLAQDCCYHSNLAVAAHGITVLANVTISCPEKGSDLIHKAHVYHCSCFSSQHSFI